MLYFVIVKHAGHPDDDLTQHQRYMSKGLGTEISKRINRTDCIILYAATLSSEQTAWQLEDSELRSKASCLEEFEDWRSVSDVWGLLDMVNQYDYIDCLILVLDDETCEELAELYAKYLGNRLRGVNSDNLPGAIIFDVKARRWHRL